MAMKIVKNPLRIWLVALAATFAAATPSSVHAQRAGAHFGSGAGPGFHTGSGFRSGLGSRYISRDRSSGAPLLAAFARSRDLSLLDPLYSDALYDAGYPVAAQPPVVILQNAGPAMSPAAAREGIPAPVPPLMIELQGDRYVRVSGDDRSGAEIVETTAGPAATAAVSQTTEQPGEQAAARPAPPAVLVYRDGHREEVSAYTIVDGTLYASGDFYTNGWWNKKIELSALNLADTVQVNHSRGLSFRLPTAPNEVIVR
jgi:hypothetical protein